MAIKVKEVLVKAYNSVKKVEQYHVLLCCIYKIIFLKLEDVSEELIL